MHYQKDLCKVLKELFPGEVWLEWKFGQVPNGFWDSPKKCRRYLRWLARQLGVTTKTDWYEVNKQDFLSNHGSGFLRRFKSPSRGLEIAYPNFRWQQWKFVHVNHGFWDDIENRLEYFRWLAKELNFKTAEDCNKLTVRDLFDNRGASLRYRYPWPMQSAN